ncbi:MAG: hypothetical protein NZ741_06525 [Armatimonadetes bacterium]|nr:hypothetical protein [Armatimonadota bacterium]
MRTVVRLGVLLIGVAVLAWAAYGFYVYQANVTPEPQLPAVQPPPADNAYEQMLRCVKGVQRDRELLQLENLPQYGTPAQKRSVLEANRPLLQECRQLLQRPVWVTRLIPLPEDPTMEYFRHVARLFAAEGKLHEQQARYGEAMSSYLDGLLFADRIARGGSTLHLIARFASSVVLFEALPPVIPRLSAAEARAASQRVQRLLEEEYPLTEVITQEFRTTLLGWYNTTRGMAMRGWRLDLPQSAPERQMLMRPKKPITEAAQRYAQQWIEQVKLPYPQVTPVAYVPPLDTLPEGMVVRSPEDLFSHVTRYVHLQTRLRLLYTALRLEEFRKARGRYPASLGELGSSPHFIDPFSGKPFVYRAQGNAYMLYSVGPNGADDGGIPAVESALRRELPGDIGVVPNFPRRPL